MALPVCKHLDPVVGVDVHMVVTPASPETPLPHPHVGFMLDYREYVSAAAAVMGCMAMEFLCSGAEAWAQAHPEQAARLVDSAGQVMGTAEGIIENVTDNPLVATAMALQEKKEALMDSLGAYVGTGGGGRPVLINNMMRTTAGTHSFHMPGLHFPFPPGTAFAPTDLNPSRDAESWMGSKTVLANNDPLTFAALPALSCWMEGMVPADHNSAHTDRTYPSMPTSFILPIPAGRPVLVGGPPVVNMVALLKGMWKAFRGSALARALADKLNLPSGAVRCWVLDAEPVHSITGEVVVEQRDFTLPGRLPFVWERYYHGHHTAPGALGAAWKTLADCQLEVLRHGELVGVVARFPERETAFDHFPLPEGEEGEVIDWQNGDRLQRHGEHLHLQTRSGLCWQFPLPREWPSRIASLPDSDPAIRAGNWQPDRQNSLVLRLQQFSDRNGNGWHCQRDARQRLTAFVELSGAATTGRVLKLNYDAVWRNAIQAVSLWVKGQSVRTLATYRYDDRGDMVAVEDAAGVPYTFGYEDGHRMVRHTNRTGLSFYYRWQKHDDGVRRVTHAWGDGGLFRYHFNYQLQNNTTLITNSLGHTTRLEYNARGFPVSRTNGMGETYSYRYDACGRTTTETDPQGNSEEWHYDARGNEVMHIHADRSLESADYAPDGQPLSVTDPTGGIWQQTYDDRGNLVAQRTPDGVITRYGYDTSGQLTTAVAPDGGVTQLCYDDYGFLRSLTHPHQNPLTFSFDAEGRLLSRRENNEETRYRYDTTGHIVNVRLTDGRTLDCSYDAEGNLLRFAEDNRRVTLFSYFGQGWLKSRTDPDGGTVRYHYDTEEQLTAVENQNGERWTFIRDAAGRVITETDYLGGERRYTYTPAGHLMQATDPVGQQLRVACDRMGRIVSTTPQGRDGGESFTYDALGRLTEAVNDTARISRRYSADGHLLEEWQRQPAFSAQHVYQWEKGRLTEQQQRLYGEGGRELLLSRHQSATYDTGGRLTQLTVDDHPSLRFDYDDRQRLSEIHCNDTLSHQFSYNLRGQLTRHSTRIKGREQARVAYQYDDNNNLVCRTDSLTGTDRYRYDLLGQITAHTDPSGHVRRFAYDATGNRFRVVAHDESGRVLEHDNGLRWQTDAAGQLRVREWGKETQRLGWDAYGRLTALVTEQGRWRYGYDALGRRLYKQQFDTAGQQLLKTTWFSWDGDRLTEEVCLDARRIPAPGTHHSHLTHPDPAWTAQAYGYHPETFMPLLMQQYQAEAEDRPLRRAGQLLSVGEAQKARLKADTLCFYQNDPNGMPLHLWSSTGGVVWSAYYSVTGEAETRSPSDITQPLRLQGQYFDEESGLHYNRYRYYDPHAGMFISTDPVGLAGGINLYAYAPNPLSYIDPLGLKCGPTKASELPVTRPGTKAWKEAVEKLRSATGHATDSAGNNVHNIRVPTQRDARQLIEEAFGSGFPRNKPQTKTGNYGYEYHRPPESTVPFDNDLQHIKWYDWRTKQGADGHVFYDVWD